MEIRLVFTGRMYHTAAELPDQIELAEDMQVRDAIATIQRIAGEAPLPSSCLVAVNGDHLGTVAKCADRTLQTGDEITLIAPVAGG